MKKNKSQFIKVKPCDTSVDERYQREFDEPRSAAMAEAFDLSLIGVPVISRREDGRMVRLDGQHRFGAAIIAGLGNTAFMCEVYDGLSIQEEAEMFLRLNSGRSAVRAYDKFRARLVSGEPVAVAIVVVLTSLALKFQKTSAKNAICAVQALDCVYHRGNLRETLEVIKDWADGEPASFEKQIIRAVSFFLSEYPDVSRTELASKLRSYAPSRVMARIRCAMAQLDCKTRLASCLAIREIYNERRKRNLLPPPGKFTEEPIAA